MLSDEQAVSGEEMLVGDAQPERLKFVAKSRSGIKPFGGRVRQDLLVSWKRVVGQLGQKQRSLVDMALDKRYPGLLGDMAQSTYADIKRVRDALNDFLNEMDEYRERNPTFAAPIRRTQPTTNGQQHQTPAVVTAGEAIGTTTTQEAQDGEEHPS